MKPPAFQFYADEYLAGTIAMSPAEVGAYIRLLCYQWSNGSIPDDPRKLKRIVGGPVSADVLAKFKPAGDGRLANQRLELERRKQTDYREKQRQKGLQSGVARRTGNEPRLNSGSPPVRTGSQPEPPSRWPEAQHEVSASHRPRTARGLPPAPTSHMPFRGRQDPGMADAAPPADAASRKAAFHSGAPKQGPGLGSSLRNLCFPDPELRRPILYRGRFLAEGRCKRRQIWFHGVEANVGRWPANQVLRLLILPFDTDDLFLGPQESNQDPRGTWLTCYCPVICPFWTRTVQLGVIGQKELLVR